MPYIDQFGNPAGYGGQPRQAGERARPIQGPQTPGGIGLPQFGQLLSQPDPNQQRMNELQRQLMFAQIQGANPMQIANLQQQIQAMQQGQRGNQVATMFRREQTRPGFGAGAVGSGRPGVSQMRGNQLYDMETQMLLALMGAGGGPSGPIMG